jgi:hypothetical protein
MANKTVDQLTNKTTPVDADYIPLWDSVTSILQKLSWANLKATLKTYFDGFYPTYTTPASETATGTGFGTITSLNYKTSRDGAFLNGEFTFTTGTTTATEARFELKHAGGSVTSAADYPTLFACGVAFNASNTAAYPVLIEASKTYVTFGVQAPGSSAGLVKRNGDTVSGNSVVISGNFSVRITGWT